MARSRGPVTSTGSCPFRRVVAERNKLFYRLCRQSPIEGPDLRVRIAIKHPAGIFYTGVATQFQCQSFSGGTKGSRILKLVLECEDYSKAGDLIGVAGSRVDDSGPLLDERVIGSKAQH